MNKVASGVVKYLEGRRLRESSGWLFTASWRKSRGAYWVTKLDKDFNVLKSEGLQTELLKVPAHILCHLLGQAERLLWSF